MHGRARTRLVVLLLAEEEVRVVAHLVRVRVRARASFRVRVRVRVGLGLGLAHVAQLHLDVVISPTSRLNLAYISPDLAQLHLDVVQARDLELVVLADGAQPLLLDLPIQHLLHVRELAPGQG